MDDPTIFVIVIALVFTSVPVTVAIIQEIQRRKMRAAAYACLRGAGHFSRPGRRPVLRRRTGALRNSR